MKKIGILTFHRACNYGAFLQTYAFHKILNSYSGISAEVIDYRPYAIERNYNLRYVFSLRGGVKSLILRIIRLKSITRRNNIFNEYVEREFQLGNFQIEKLNQRYDRFVVGSDQIWNRKLTEEDDVYFLSFSEDCKKYSFAGSLGQVIQENLSDKTISLLSSFQYLSFRERDAYKIFDSLIPGVPKTVTADPVFLLRSEEWIHFSGDSHIKHEDYVLIFIMGVSKNADFVVDAALDFSKKHKKKLLLLGDQERWYKYRNIKHFGIATPKDFIRLIDQAYCVFTNSFHATSFSIILNTPFYTECNIENPSRIELLLQEFGLSERKMYSGQIKESVQEINWQTVNEQKEEIRKQALLFIEETIVNFR